MKRYYTFSEGQPEGYWLKDYDGPAIDSLKLRLPRDAAFRLIGNLLNQLARDADVVTEDLSGVMEVYPKAELAPDA